MTKQAKQTLQYVLDNGVMRGDRTGKGRHSVFSPPDEIYNLKDGYPFPTLRRLSPDAMVTELLWFLSGSTNLDDLENKFFWKRWVPTEQDLVKYCEAVGLPYDRTAEVQATDGKRDEYAISERLGVPLEIAKRVATIGHLYGVSWRHAPGPKGNLHPVRLMADLPSSLIEKFIKTDDGEHRASVSDIVQWLDNGEEGDVYNADARAIVRGAILAEYWKNYDQINELVYKIKNTPFSSRLRVSAYVTDYMAFEEFSPQENTMDGRACLTPCHTFFQCYVTDKGDGSPRTLDLKLTLTSSDVPAGRVFNVAQYALLTHMLAQVCGLEVGRLIVSTGDAHIYGDQFEAVETIMAREPFPMPKLWLNPEVKDIFAFTVNDVRVENYEAHPPVKVPVAV